MIAAGLELAAQIFTLINSLESRKYVDRIISIRLELVDEESKGYDSDDAKIETLHQECTIIMEAAKVELSKVQVSAKT